MAGLMPGAVGGWLGVRLFGLGGPTGDAAPILAAFDEQRSVLGTTEDVVLEVGVNFAEVAGPTLAFRLTGLVEVEGGGTATYNVRLGGTVDTADGTIVATITSGAAAFTLVTSAPGAVVANPGTLTLLKITAKHDTVAALARIRGASINRV